MGQPHTTEQAVSPGGGHVAELIQPAVPAGRHNGYITRRASVYAVFGCTCGAYADGPVDEVNAAFHAHVTAPEFGGTG